MAFAQEGTYKGKVIAWGLGWTKDPAKLKAGEKAGINLVMELEYTHEWDRRNKEYVELSENLFSNARLCIVKKDGTPNDTLLDSLNEAFGMKLTPKSIMSFVDPDNGDLHEDIKAIEITGTVKDTNESGEGRPYYATTWVAVNGDGPAGFVKKQDNKLIDMMEGIFQGKAKFDAKNIPSLPGEDEAP